MSETKHTPGPWEAKGDMVVDEAGRAVALICSPPEMRISEALLPGESWLNMRERTRPKRLAQVEEMYRRARLIAAAPDLLAALEEIRDYRGGAANALEDEYVMARVDAAIAKARGEVGDE